MLFEWETSLIRSEKGSGRIRGYTGRPYLLLHSEVSFRKRHGRGGSPQPGRLPFAFPGEGIKPMRLKEDSSQ